MTGGSSLKFDVLRFDGKGNFGLWQRREEMQDKAVSTIRLCLSDDITHQVMDLTTCKEMWDKLEKMYMSKSLSSKLYLKQRLFGLKMSENGDLVAHVNNINQIIGDLVRVDVKIKDKDQAMILLCSMTPQYETILWWVTTLKVTDCMSAKIEERQRGKQPDGTSRKRSKSKFGKKVVCYRCGKPGKTVPKKGQNSKETTNSANIVQKNDDSEGSADSDMLVVTSVTQEESGGDKSDEVSDERYVEVMQKEAQRGT
ncbi:hypothetical protein Bca101_032153 [Brassica carinata]